ncbi:hypothetical protein B1B04_13045 [Lysinibacillus sp. KCTC 33748]|uniref:hypothetical protein n=1 Tax=unclassified Lysinibacillus TaxID=2636778 RepID=UPI0009A8B2E0|nr:MULTISPECIES: hypothetical protein [unclassified Lysinibacillus]OXS73208.1 hypothetical protein B1B04_13045 [Lysinibacillus sp. KCTC 33748]SKB82607.1 hypothetical protein SAMN06295926_10963 [Lysinibacillus sp. AC-3]
MKRRIVEQLAKLLEIRNIIALSVSMLFVVLSLSGVLQVDFIQSIIMAVVIFFFAKGSSYDETRKYPEDEKSYRQ